MMFSIFCCACLSSVYLPWWHVSLIKSFKIFILFLMNFEISLYIVIHLLSDIHITTVFFQTLDSVFWRRKVFNFDEVQFINLLFLWIILCTKKSLHNSQLQGVFWCCMILWLLFRSVIHFESVFVSCMKYGSKFFFSYIFSIVPAKFLGKKLSFLHWIVSAPLSRICCLFMGQSISKLFILSCWLIFLSFYQ